MNFKYIVTINIVIFAANLVFGNTGLIEPQITTVPSETEISDINSLELVPYKPRRGFLKIDSGYYYVKGNIEIDKAVSIPALFISPTTYPLNIQINGKEIFRWGEGKKSKFLTNYRGFAVNLSSVYNKTEKNRILITFYTDGLNNPLPKFEFGEYSRLEIKAFWNTFFNFQMITAMVVAIFFAAIIFTGYFMVSGQREREILYFVLTCVSFIVGYIIMVFNSQAFSELILFKISRFGFLLMAYFMMRFFQSYTGIWMRQKKLFWIPFYLAIFASLYMIFLNSKNSIDSFFYVLLLALVIPEILIMSLMIILDLKSGKRIDKYVITLGFMFMIAVAFRDMYFSINSLMPNIWVMPYGFFVQLMSIAIAITMRQRQLFMKTIDYKERLMKANTQIQLEASKRERFLDTIASELRSPMNGLEERINDIEKEKSHYFNSISGAFRRIRLTLNNIFDYVAIRDGQLRILNYNFDIYSSLNVLSSFYSEMANKKGITFTIAYDKALLPQFFYGDREHLIQVLDNLMHNSIKYTNEGGVACAVTYRNKEIIISVSDTGAGIDEKGKANLRKAISSEEYISFSEKYEGVGLGLTITDMIVRKMNGRINLESRKDQGTTILVSIPMKVKEMKKSFETGGKMLVVEDNKVNMMIITKLLKKSGYEYKTVDNGLKAVQEVEKNSFDAVLMDVEMPVMDGIEATKKIRTFDQKTPIIAVTANGQYRDCIAAGMNDHLMKPVNFEYLKEILKKYTEQKVKSI